MKKNINKTQKCIKIEEPLRFKRVLVKNVKTNETIWSLPIGLNRKINKIIDLHMRYDINIYKNVEDYKIVKIEEYDYKETLTDEELANHIDEILWLINNNVKFKCSDDYKNFKEWYASEILNNCDKSLFRITGCFFFGWKDLYVDTKGMLKVSKELEKRVKKYLANKFFIRNKTTRIIVGEVNLPVYTWKHPEKIKDADVYSDLAMHGKIFARDIFKKMGFYQFYLNYEPADQFIDNGACNRFPMKQYNPFDKWLQCQFEAVRYDSKGNEMKTYRLNYSKSRMSWYEGVAYMNKHPKLPPILEDEE